MRRDSRLLEARRDDAVDAVAMLRALADRVDQRIGSLHAVVHADAAPHVQPRGACELDVRLYAGRDDDRVAFQRSAAAQRDAAHAVASEHAHHAVAQDHLEPEPLHVLQQMLRAGLVELAHHEPREVLDDADVRIETLHGARGFEAEQTAAEHDGAALRTRRAMSFCTSRASRKV